MISSRRIAQLLVNQASHLHLTRPMTTVEAAQRQKKETQEITSLYLRSTSKRYNRWDMDLIRNGKREQFRLPDAPETWQLHLRERSNPDYLDYSDCAVSDDYNVYLYRNAFGCFYLRGDLGTDFHFIKWELPDLSHTAFAKNEECKDEALRALIFDSAAENGHVFTHLFTARQKGAIKIGVLALCGLGIASSFFSSSKKIDPPASSAVQADDLQELPNQVRRMGIEYY